MSGFEKTRTSRPGAEVEVSGGGGGSTHVHVTVDADWLKTAMGGEQSVITLDIRDGDRVARFFVAPCVNNERPSCRITGRHRGDRETDRRAGATWRTGYYSPHNENADA